MSGVSTLSREELVAYTRYAQRVSEDVEALRDDVAYQLSGGTLHIAVDFSEIHAFLAPSAHDDENWLWPGLDNEARVLVEHCALSEIFARRTGNDRDVAKTVLLAPYAVEFHNFLSHIRDRLEREYSRRAADALELLDELREKPGASDLLALGEEFAITARALTPGEILTTTTFFEEHASALIGLVRRGIDPLVRAKAFLERKPFAALDSVVPVQVRGDEPEVRARYNKLLDRRNDQKPGATYIDAVAIELVRRAALQLRRRGDNARLLFVSRSRRIAELFESGDVAVDGLQFRHPRAFGVLAWHAARPLDEIATELQSTKDSLDLFWKSAKLRLMGSWDQLQYSRTDDQPLIDAVIELKTQVLKLVRMGATINESEIASMAGATLQDEGATVLRLLGILRNRHEVFTAVAERMSEINAQVDRHHELLGVYVESRSASASGQIERAEISVERQASGDAALVNRFGVLAYELRFESEPLRRLADQERDHPSVTRENVWQFLATATREAYDHYETLLFMAYVLAIVRRWDVATKYCQRALLSARHHSRRQPTEALFFLAFCIRKSAETPQQLQTGLEYLERARQCVPDDPRVMAEFGTAKLLWRLHADTDRHWASNAPTLDEAVDLLDRAKRLSGDDRRLLVMVLNNLCYALTHAPAADGSQDSRLLPLVIDLERSVSTIEPDSGRWPSQIADTVAWAHVRLYGDAFEPEKMQKWVSSIEAQLERQPEGDRHVLNEHLAVFKSALTQQLGAARTKPPSPTN